jgi:hypothetical protein
MLSRRIAQQFFMEIIILMTWAIWNTRSGWIFKNEEPMVDTCKRKFIKDFKLLLYRAKKNFPTIEQWLEDITLRDYIVLFLCN